MTPKSFIAFSSVTAALVVATIALVATQPAPTTISRDRALVFPELTENLNDVRSMEIKSASRTFSVERKQDGWGIKELGGYTANFDKVKTALVQLSEFRFLESKTSDPTRYSRLDLGEIDKKGAKSRRVTLRAKGDKVVALALIGKQNRDLLGTGKGGTYVRVGDGKQTWLVEGAVILGKGPADWVDRNIIDIKRPVVKQLMVMSPKSGVVVVAKKKAGAKDYKLEAIPRGKRQRGQWETNDMANLLEGLKLIDLRRADEIPFEANATYKATIQTWDGLLIHTESAKIGKKYWVRLSASVNPNAGSNAERAADRVKNINARHKGYVYEIDEKPGKKLTCDMINLLEGAGLKACA
jgi:hypothetical protein